MKGNLLILVFFGLAFFLLPVVQVSASPAHDHETISPFDKKKHGHKQHCELHKHHLSKVYCPYHNFEKNKTQVVITTDCSGKTSGTLLPFGSYNSNVFSSCNVHFKLELVLISRKIIDIFYAPRFSLLEQIDHPPKTV